MGKRKDPHCIKLQLGDIKLQLQEIKWQLPFYFVFTLRQKQDSIGDLTSDYVLKDYVTFFFGIMHTITQSSVNASLVAHAHS